MVADAASAKDLWRQPALVEGDGVQRARAPAVARLSSFINARTQYYDGVRRARPISLSIAVNEVRGGGPPQERGLPQRTQDAPAPMPQRRIPSVLSWVLSSMFAHLPASIEA